VNPNDQKRLPLAEQLQSRTLLASTTIACHHAKLELRHSARLIILDPDGRLLLFRYQDEHKPAFWSTAGGELKAKEEYRDAAQRELQEETGFRFEVGPLLHEREDLYAVARSQPAHWIEHYFLVACDRAGTPSRANWTDEERTTIQEWKWWGLAEMRDQPNSFLPMCLPEILERALGLTKRLRRNA
jgi:8-oxo-dGTP diphosphatase